MDVGQWWKDLIAKANSQGVPIPMVRYRGEANPALTLVVISSIFVIVGIVGKWSGHLGGIDMANAMQFFWTSTTLFFGHTWVNKSVTGATTEISGGTDGDVPPINPSLNNKGPI